MSFKYERKINYYETDKMGIVHHSNHIRFRKENKCGDIIIQYLEIFLEL